MPQRPWLTPTLAFLFTLIIAWAASASDAPSTPTPGPAPAATNPTPATNPAALDGEWLYVEDRTEGRAPEQFDPPMASKFSMRVEENGIILNNHGSGHKDVRIALDGSATEIPEPNRISRYTGSWKDGTFAYQVEFERKDGNAPEGALKMIRRSFRPTPEGLLVTVTVEPPGVKAPSVGLYRHAEDIAMPASAKAVIGDLSWLSGAWVGARPSGSSIEERWSPVLGGAMLAVSRTVNASGKMVAFEYLRIVERDAGLVYIAQPGGKAPTEFVLTELSPKHAVFENPRNDYPKRITYELTGENGLVASIGFTKGGTPRRFEFTREAK